MGLPPFHLAFPVHDLQAARSFYVDLLGCRVGRESERWIDFDFHGHQITAHLEPRAAASSAQGAKAAAARESVVGTDASRPSPEPRAAGKGASRPSREHDDRTAPAHNEVDGRRVPVRHFGAVLGWDDWHALAERLREAGVAFLIEPHVRFRGEPGEQATLFIADPSGNALEFKSFRDPDRLFAR